MSVFAELPSIFFAEMKAERKSEFAFLTDSSDVTVGIMSMVGAYTTKWGEIGAGLMIATIPTVIMYLLLSEQVQQSLVAGAVKG